MIQRPLLQWALPEDRQVHLVGDEHPGQFRQGLVRQLRRVDVQQLAEAVGLQFREARRLVVAQRPGRDRPAQPGQDAALIAWFGIRCHISSSLNLSLLIVSFILTGLWAAGRDAVLLGEQRQVGRQLFMGRRGRVAVLGTQVGRQGR